MDDHKSKDRSALMDVEYEDIAISYLFLMIKKAIRDSGYSEKWDPKVDGERLVDERYGEYPLQKMDVYVPKTIDPSKSRGAFLFMHGGAYVGGDRREQEGVAKAMAKEGYLTANIEYTLYNKTLKERRSSCSVDMLLEDVRLALTKLVEIGRQHGYNVEKVALSGHSAGGHVSMLYGFRSRTLEGFESPVEVAFVAPRVCCVDFHADMWKSGKNPKIMTWFTSFLSGVPIGKRLYFASVRRQARRSSGRSRVRSEGSVCALDASRTAEEEIRRTWRQERRRIWRRRRGRACLRPSRFSEFGSHARARPRLRAEMAGTPQDVCGALPYRSVRFRNQRGITAVPPLLRRVFARRDGRTRDQ